MSEELAFDFERFTGTGTSYKPKVSIRSSGQLGFSVGAIRRFALNNFEYAVLFFDAQNRAIGIKPTNEPEEGANKLRVRDSGADVTAKAFLQYYQLPHQETRQYEAEWNSQHNMIIVRLDTPSRPMTEEGTGDDG